MVGAEEVLPDRDLFLDASVDLGIHTCEGGREVEGGSRFLSTL